MKGKKYLIFSICILVSSLVFFTYALVYYYSDPTDVYLKVDSDLEGYINYNNSDPVFGSDNMELVGSSTYDGGVYTDIELWKKSEFTNINLYGHIYLELNEISSTVLSEPGFKYTVVSNNVVLSSGNFTDYSEGDDVMILKNRLLSPSEEHFRVYIWIDINNLVSNDIEDEELNIIVKSEVTSEMYS